MLDSVDSQSITLMIAGVVMIIIPSISIFIIGQKQLIRGMFSGAVKRLIPERTINPEHFFHRGKDIAVPQGLQFIL